MAQRRFNPIQSPDDLEEDSCAVGSRVPPVKRHEHHDGAFSKDHNTMKTMLDSTRCDSGVDSCLSGDLKSDRETSVTMSTRPTIQPLSNQSHIKSRLGDSECPSFVDSGYDSTQSLELGVQKLSLGTVTAQTTSLHAQQRFDYVIKIFEQDEEGDNQLMIAVIQLLPDVAIGMIGKAPSAEYLNMTNGYHQTTMHLAVLVKLPTVVNALLQAGASSEIVDCHGNTPLHLACQGGDEKCIHILTHPLKQDVNALNFEGLSCLHIAAMNDHPRIMYYLIKKCGANINVKDGKSGRTPLHYAAENDNQRLVELLLNWEADIEAMTFDNSTPLRLAAGRRHQRIVMILMNFGADTEALSSFSSDDSDDYDDDDEMDADDIKIDGQPI